MKKNEIDIEIQLMVSIILKKLAKKLDLDNKD